MPFALLDTVVLTRDLPELGLRAGDVGAVVEVYGEAAFEVEFVLPSGETKALATLVPGDLRAVTANDVWLSGRLDCQDGQTRLSGYTN